MKYNEIIEKSKIICYPCVHGDYSVSVDIGTIGLMDRFFPGKGVDVAFGNGLTYLTYPANNHHFNVMWQQSVIAPCVLGLFGMGFNMDDFETTPYFLDTGNDLQDLSYLKPKREQSFSVTDIESGNNVLKKNLFRDDGDVFCMETYAYTNYHRFLWCTHKCALIKNNNIHNGKSLIVSCDSQMVPVIPILACYFGEILHLDKRDTYDISGYLERDYDCVLVAHWCSDSCLETSFFNKMYVNFQQDVPAM